MTTHMEDLPEELLLLILDQLPDSDLIDIVPSVCLRWSRLSLNCHIWKNRTYTVYRQSASAAFKFFSRKPALRSVTFHEQVDESVLRSLVSHCPTITSLRFYSWKPLPLDILHLITRNCDQIRELCVPSEILSCPDKVHEMALMPRLETLRVYVRQPLQLQLRELSGGCERLRNLHIVLDNFRLGDLGAPLLRRLHELSISMEAVSPDIVHCAENLEKLTLHCFGFSSQHDSALAEDLLSLKALTHVVAVNLDRGPEVLRALMQPQLRSLNLCGCRNLDDDLLLELCGRCPLLEDLDLFKCHRITARGLSSMWSLQRLRRLCLDGCRGLGSGAMTHLVHCDGLQELSIQCVDINYMEPGVSQLLELRNLRYLSFYAWSARDLISWEKFPKAFHHLRTLELGWWHSKNTSLLESLKAAMPRTQVMWDI